MRSFSSFLLRQVAIKYAKSDHPLIMKIRSEGFEDRGADICACHGQPVVSKHLQYFRIVSPKPSPCPVPAAFLSAFPSEKEILFPPLTMFRATKGEGGCIRKDMVAGTLVT